MMPVFWARAGRAGSDASTSRNTSRAERMDARVMRPPVGAQSLSRACLGVGAPVLRRQQFRDGEPEIVHHQAAVAAEAIAERGRFNRRADAGVDADRIESV